MVKVAQLFPAMLLAIVVGCSPYFVFEGSRTPSGDLIESFRVRVEQVLRDREFSLTESNQTELRAAAWDLADCAPIDLETYERRWRSSLLLNQYYWILVFTFSCENDHDYIVILPSGNAFTEADELRNTLAQEFRRETLSSDLTIKMKWRFDFS